MAIGGKVMKMIMKSSMGAGQEIRKGGREDKESPGHDQEVDARHSYHVEDARHDDEEDQDEGHDHEDEDAGADDDGPSMGWV